MATKENKEEQTKGFNLFWLRDPLTEMCAYTHVLVYVLNFTTKHLYML
jgi:hypothetical protein